VYSVGILIAQLLNDLLDPVKFLCSSEIPNNTLETARASAALKLYASEIDAYSRAPTLRLSYNLSFKARWMLWSIMAAHRSSNT
jgi:hypothetical protein